MKIKGVLVDIISKEIKVKEIENSLESYYETLDCDLIEIVSRNIGGKEYAIVCDEEGLLKGTPIVSAFNSEKEAMFVGNLFIVNNGSKGELASLTEKDIELVLKEGHLIETKDGKVNVAMRVEY